MAGKSKKVTARVTTGIGTFSFPHVFKETAEKKEDGRLSYEIQILIPKTDPSVREILKAIKTVGEAQWGDRWKSVRSPLRDGDAEKDDLTEDGSTKGEKYPERLGCYFINARSSKPVGVYDRARNPITDSGEIYGGAKGKISVSFYPYVNSGNQGIGAGLEGVQKIADGESFGGSAPSVEVMFDEVDDDEVLGAYEDEAPVKEKKDKKDKKKKSKKSD